MRHEAKKLMSNSNEPMTKRYKAWERLLYKAAISSIGKTTYKCGAPPRASKAMEALRAERRKKKREFQSETDSAMKKEKMSTYISMQNKIRALATKEERERVVKRFEKMREAGVNGFWKERKRMSTDKSSSWFITKDNEGRRSFETSESHSLRTIFLTLKRPRGLSSCRIICTKRQKRVVNGDTSQFGSKVDFK